MPEIRKDLKPFEEIGFRFIGFDGGTHYVLEHPDAGRIRVSLTPSRQSTRGHELASAKRKIIHGRATAEAFLDWLWDHYEIPRDGSKLVKADMPYIVDRWIKVNNVTKPNSDMLVTSKAVMTWCVQQGYIVVKHAAAPGRAGRKVGVQVSNGEYLLRGRDWNVSTERPEALKHANGNGHAPPPSTVPKGEAKAAQAKKKQDKLPGLEVAPGVFLDPTKVPAPQPAPAPTTASAPRPDQATPAVAISNVVTVDAAEYLELRAMLTALTSAILPEAIEKRDVARDALTRAERALSASIGAMSDALGDVRAALELLNSEASMAPVEETATA